MTTPEPAGGINGLYLSYALCAERKFEPLGPLWREKAGFHNRLHRTVRCAGPPLNQSDLPITLGEWLMASQSRQ